MPNHVTNRLVVTGPPPAIAAFRRAFFSPVGSADGSEDQGASLAFDFNRIIPMPDIVRQTESSSAVSTGLLILGRPEILGDGFGGGSLEEQVAQYLTFPWVQEAGITDYEGLKAFLAKRDPSCVAKARVAIRAFETCGHASWYSWSLCHWGTKWNAYFLDIVTDTGGMFEFRFATAWSPPDPVFAALAERPECEGLDIAISGFDEGWNFAYRASIADGCYMAEEVEPTAEFYADVYGKPWDSGPDEEDGQAAQATG